jgi:MraZ protein
MFRGCHYHVLDEKGRTSLPKDFREILAAASDAPFLTALPDCLAIYTAEEFDALGTRLREASATIQEVQSLQRLYSGMAVRCPIDRQGRILIPQELRGWATLEREIVLTGVGDRIEIWDRVRHRAELERLRHHYSEMTSVLTDFKL